MLNPALHLVRLLVGEGQEPLTVLAYRTNQERRLVGATVGRVGALEHGHSVLHLTVVGTEEDDVVDFGLHAEEHVEDISLLLCQLAWQRLDTVVLIVAEHGHGTGKVTILKPVQVLHRQAAHLRCVLLGDHKLRPYQIGVLTRVRLLLVALTADKQYRHQCNEYD